jgi:hypothetical protein
MPIEMKIYKEIRGYEAKAMFGFTWRQLAALAVMIFVGGAVFAGTTLVLLGAGSRSNRRPTSPCTSCSRSSSPRPRGAGGGLKDSSPSSTSGSFFAIT